METCWTSSHLINYPNIIKTLSYNLQKKGRIPAVTYKLGDTIRNNNLNYKDAVNSIYVMRRYHSV